MTVSVGALVVITVLVAVGYAVRGATLWRTDDGGETWRALKP